MSKFLDLFIRNKAVETSPMICLSSSGDTEIQNYTVKDDRSSEITYSGVGRVKYGAGIPPSVYETVLGAISKYPIVYGCVTARSDAAAGLGIKIFDLKGGQEGEVKDHPFYQTFTNPNPYQGSFEFLEQISQSLDVTGNAFVAIEGSGKTVELYLLPTKYMAVIPDAKTKVKEYHYYINGKFVLYKPEEIIHIKYSNVDDTYYGAPPLASANDILTFEDYRIQFANQFFKNGAVPVGLLETEAVLGDSLLRKLRGEWSAIHGGISNAHKVAILQGGLKYKSLTSPLKDLELGNLKRLSKEDIQMIFKVPDSILGSMDGTGGKEGKDSLTMFWRNSMIPHVQRIESALNRGLKKVLFKDGKQLFRFNLKAVAALSDDKESTASYLSTLLSGSVMTPNEARAVVGLPPSTDPNADKLFISNSMYGNQLIPADQAGQANANNAEKPTAKPAEATAKPAAPKPPKAKKDYDFMELEDYQIRRDVALASTGQLKLTKPYLEKTYGFKSEDVEIVNDARTVDLMIKEQRVYNASREEKALQEKVAADLKMDQVVEVFTKAVEDLAEDVQEKFTGIQEATEARITSVADAQKKAFEKSLQAAMQPVTKQVDLYTKAAELQTASFKDIVIDISKNNAEVSAKQFEAILNAEPKQMEVTINNPPMDINLQVDTKSGNVKRTATFIRDENGDMVSATTEEVSE